MKEKIQSIPTNPGCYIYKDNKGKIIYIGKAKNLRKRVNSYFTKKDLDSKTEVLVKQIKDIDFIVTNTEVEALLLENNLIKKNKPKYNIDLKDSKSYAFIEITNEEFPRIISARTEIIKKKKEVGKLFGPFISGDSRNLVLELLNKTFKIRTCKKLPKKKCIRYDIGICSAPCIKKITKEDYLNSVENAELVLKGKTKELLEKLKREMSNYSKKEEFEKALSIKNQINGIEYIKEKQNVERKKKYDEDIINYTVKNEKVYLILFNINHGLLENKKSFDFDYRENFLEEFLVQYYSEEEIPKVLVLPEEVDFSLLKFLELMKKEKVKTIVPKRGELKELLELVKKNIEIQFFGNIEKMDELKKILNLPSSPEVIECFDISHLGGTQVVASMVQFKNGKKDTSNYRKFKIREGDKNDDFKAMREVVKRRYSRLKKEGNSFPDLIVIDGGLGQLNSSLFSLQEIGVTIPIISLAKKFEEIYIPGENIPIRVSEKNKGRKFLEEIRNEAHRFAVKYQRERRSKSYFEK